jgi:CARDB protein
MEPGTRNIPMGPVTLAPVLRPPDLGPVQPFDTKIGGFLPSQQTDLVVASFGLTADGRMTYIVVNRGRTAANSPFVVDLFIDGTRKDTVKHNALPPLSQQGVISNLARPEVCSAVQLRIALDTQQLVNEGDEANNTLLRQLVPPCPDLVVDIDKDSVSNGLKYRAKVQVTNRGNLTTKREFFVLLKGSGSGMAFAALPILKRERMGPLVPGQTVSFYEGGDHLGTSTFHYWALADQLEEIRESNENNNDKQETMGGGY